MRTLLALILPLSAVRAGAQPVPPILIGAPVVTSAIVETAIRLLGSEAFREREWASRTLVAIGGPALPAIRAARGSGDAEVRRRAETAWNEILDGIAARPALSDAALARIEALRAQMTKSAEALAGRPSAEWIAAQERLVAAADRMLDPNLGGMYQEEVDARLRAFRNSPPQGMTFGDEERNRHALIFLAEAVGRSRLALARGYSLSDNADDRRRAVGYLTQVVRLLPQGYMQTQTATPRQENGATYESFPDIAARAGARNDPDFVGILPKDSAQGTLERIEQLESK